MPIEDVQQLLEAEARAWIGKGYSSPERIQELRATITKHRGAAAAEKLIQEMRRQYRRLREEEINGQQAG
ncbi:hypothetical protein [Ectopseudomonas oleovorans]|uniref:Uncharacterized protein n=1 Tax=Ectopseudomonas oleovorans TaxID=301 RepID=A0A3D9EDQ9_ECTOL|nr:hypothetical protein [Pseudomonas oleovorans]RED01253.1 hypothetical protein DFO60_4095 [Pseudomonas oleovorans]